MKAVLLSGVAVLMLATPICVAAQDANKTATYGEIALSAGFTPDPYRVR